MQVRTRFAPSPTGYLHIGNVRAALFPWLVAKHNHGRFILRIEDTDQAREVTGAVDVIKETLGWLEIHWDEGPDIGGPFGPYIQTERLSHYTFWAKKLIDKGAAYADTRSPQELDRLRSDAKSKKLPFLARNYRPDNPPVWRIGIPLRFKSSSKSYTWQDEIMGKLSAGPEATDDFILIKSDGLPTYNFAHIIDDHEMKITHVIRGLEYISSMPKYLNLYEALELPQPAFGHMPHVMAPDGRKKLSKREGAKSVLDYKAEGFLPEAMINYLASLGWNDKSQQEIYTRQQIIEKFDLSEVQRSGAKFDETRLIWMNGQYIRDLPLDKLYARAIGFWPSSSEAAAAEYKKQVLELVQERLKYLSELPGLSGFFFADPSSDAVSKLFQKPKDKQLIKIDQKQLLTQLSAAEKELKKSDFSRDDLRRRLNYLLGNLDTKPSILFAALRIAVTGAAASPELVSTLNVLGKPVSLRRLKLALGLLGKS